MSEHKYQYGRILNLTKHWFAGQVRGRPFGALLKRPLTILATIFTLAVLLVAPGGDALARPLFASVPDLGTAANFAILGATTVTSTGLTIVTGDVGVYPGTAITGFPPGVIVNGTSYPGGPVAAQAQADAAIAYGNLTGQACDFLYGAVAEIGGLTLLPGVHCFPSSAKVTGILTLDAQGDPNAVFVFNVGSTLETAAAAQVVVINSDYQTGCNVGLSNVYWAVGSSATLGEGTQFAGNIIAFTSNTLTTGATVDGRIISLGGAVTLDANLASQTCDTPPLAALMVEKVVVNDSGGTLQASNFSFQVNGGTPVAFEPIGQNEFIVEVDTYNVTESLAPGYTTTYSNCSNVQLAFGETSTCTITNDDQPATLTVQKIVVNDNGGTLEASDFSFQVNGGTAVAFEADGQNQLTVNAGVYEITESLAPGYTTTYDNCSNLTLALGGAATCTITNDDQPATLTVQKVVVNDSGGTLEASDFSFQVNGGTAVAFEADGQNQLTVNAGVYEITESLAPGYVTTYSNCSNLTLALGGAATCTITNDDQPATLTVQKVVVNDSGGTLAASDFSFQVNGGTAVAFEADGQNQLTVNAGVYEITESLAPGYTTTYDNCSNLTLALGGAATCTITNDDQPATLIVQKVVVNDSGGALAASDFSFQVNGGTAVAFEADGENQLTVNAGVYTITEPPVAGYTTTYNNCSNVVLALGSTATCTITNDDQPATLIVQKVVVNDSGGASEASDFSFQVNGGTAVAFEADGENQFTVNAGVYEITEVEEDAPGYVTTYSNCSNLVLALGSTATCTITNDDQPATLTVRMFLPQVENFFHQGGEVKSSVD